MFNLELRFATELTELMCLNLIGPTSSYTRQCALPYHIQCRVTLDNMFRCTRFNVQLHMTECSAVPGQCRETLDSAFRCTRCTWGTAVAQWLGCCATNRKFAGSIPAGVIGIFFGIKSFRSHYCPGVDSASNRNEYQDYFLGL